MGASTMHSRLLCFAGVQSTGTASGTRIFHPRTDAYSKGNPSMLSIALTLLLNPFVAHASLEPSAPAAGGFSDRVFKDADGKEFKYVVFVPHDYSADKAWPVILFLHGAGERGSDGKAQVEVGLGPAIQKREKTFPFIIVFPQCAPGGSWRAESPDGRRALQTLAE